MKMTQELTEFIEMNSSRFTFSAFLRPDHIQQYVDALLNKEGWLEKRRKPFFEEEIKVDDLKIWQDHSETIHDLLNRSEPERTNGSSNFFPSVSIQEFLILIGQRLTPGSFQDAKALPPKDEDLIHTFQEPYNAQITIGVRAWEKHIGRTGDFWGKLKGSPHERATAALKKVEHLLANATWWNVYGHYKHGRVYETRNKEGYGLRWQLEPLVFIGMVEPFKKDTK